MVVGGNNNSSSRRPLVQFNAAERARLVDLMPSRKKTARRGGRRRTRGGGGSGGSKKIRVIKGRVNVRIPGYGLQKLTPSSLIPFLPSVKVRQAAKKVFNATHRIGKKSKRGKARRKTGRRRRRATV